ncbi:MAG: tetratricopeptide repeat protein [candidate division WOR-3 bacterium]|nr:tetratricopeptide repeat protein [candidate division WOR-3 bacterium]
MIEKEQFDEAARLLADLYEEDKGSAFEIEEYVNKLLEQDESNLTGLDLLLSIYYNRGQPEKSKTLLEYVFSLEGDQYSEIAEKHYRKLNEKYPENTDFLLGFALALIKNRKITESKSIILKSVSRQTGILYDIIPAFYEPASENSEIAAGILDIIKAIDRNSIDPFLYDYTLTETLYLAGNIKDSIDSIMRMLENYPDKEDAIMEIGERLSKRYPNDTNILEFKFNYHIAKENFDKALQSTMQLYENKDLIGHVLDNLYVLYRHQPDNYEIVKNILMVLDEMGMYERIINESDDFIENIPDERSGIVRYYIGKSYAKKGKVDDAAQYIFQAITLDNSIIEEAITILKEALDVDYSSIRLHYALAHAYNNNNMISEAVDELMNIYQLDNSQIETVTRDLLNFYETNRSNPKIAFGLGRLFLISKEYPKAVQKFKETYELDNSFIEPILNHLSSLQENENIESGEILYLMGVLYYEKNMPKMSADYLYNAMSIETDLKQPVLNQLRKIINTHPDDIYARFSLAQIYIEMANYVQAIQILRQIETIDPRESNNIIEYYNTMLAKEPDNPVILMSMADSYLQMGKIDRAIDIFNKILSIDRSQIDDVLERLLEFPDKNIDIQLFLSDLYKEKGDYSSAVNWLNAVYISDFSKHGIIRDKLNDLLDQYPNQSNALMLLSKIYYNLDNYEQLIELSHNIFDRSENPEMKFRSGMLLAQAYRKTDNEEKASDIIYRMKQENRELFYTVLVQFYEEEKSSRIYRLKEQFSKNEEKEEIRLEYAKYLISQNNFDKARELLSHRFSKKELDFDRLYYLGKISEKSNNLIFALQIASNLRHSMKVEHISFLIKLFKKMGYYGEIDSLLSEHKELSLSVNRNNISSNVFTEYKIIT